MGLQVALCRQGHISGDLTREFTVPISLLMHPGVIHCVLSLCLAANFSLDFTRNLQDPGRGGGGGGGGEE